MTRQPAIARTPVPGLPASDGGTSSSGAKLTGPVTGGMKGWIYRAPVLDLERVGYVLEEYFVSGSANSYRIVDGKAAGPNDMQHTEVGDTQPFTTRIFILRPADPERYNGVLMVNWQNVSAGYENGWPPEEIYNGYAWMAVSAQAMGVNGTPENDEYSLKRWDPVRYGTLNHPGDPYSYDIFAKSVAAVLGDLSDGGPMGGLNTRTVIATGGSQSAMRLATYINAVQQHEHVFDGFLLLSHFGIAAPLNDLGLDQMFDPKNGGPLPHLSRINDHGDVKILVINSQAEALVQFAMRQPDSDSFRCWEIAGAPHAPPSAVAHKNAANKRDGLPEDGAEPGRNVVEWGYVADAGIRDLAGWIAFDAMPPRFEPLAIEMTAKGPAFETDQSGNVLGGIRPPEIAAAIGTHSAGLPKKNLLGWTELFDRDRMIKIHLTREDFLKSWNDVVDRLLAEGLVLSAQAVALRKHASDFWQ